MSTERETRRVVRSWLEEGVTALPDRVLDAVLDQVPATSQRRPLWPVRRIAEMSIYARLASVAAVVIVLVVGVTVMAGGGVGGQATPSPSQPNGAAATETPPATGTPSQGALLPGEFTACVGRNEESKHGTDSQDRIGDLTVDRTRGYTWQGAIVATDPRFSGTHYYSWNGDSYTLQSGLPAQEVSAEGHRIENDAGAWQGSGYGVSFPDSTMQSALTVLVGEGAYDGLTALMFRTGGSCFFNFRGIVTDVPDTPVPYTGP